MPCTREAYPHGVGCIRWLGPAGRQPAPTELTQISKNGASSVRNILTCFAFLKSTTSPPVHAKQDCQRKPLSLYHLKRQEGFVYASHPPYTLLNMCKTAKRWQKWRGGGKKNGVYFQLLKHLEALKQKSLNESSQNHSRSLVMPLTVSH